MLLPLKKQDASQISIRDVIIEILLEKEEISSPLLFEKIETYYKTHKKSISQQAYYKSLKHLREAEIVIKTSTVVSLNKVWLSRLHQLSSRLLQNESRAETPSLLSVLPEGKSLRYEFSDIDTADAYWGHIFYELTPLQDKKVPIVLMNQHQWSLIVRPKTEERVFHDMEKKGFLTLLTLGNKTTQDMRTKKEFGTELTKINVGNSFGFDKNVYINILGDYIIEGKIDLQTHEKIDQWYESEDRYQVNQDMSEKLGEIMAQVKKVKIKITHNKKKAHLFRKKMTRDFFIPKKYEV